MKSVAVALALALACGLALADDGDQQCKNDFTSFVRCMKDTYTNKPASEKDAFKADMRQKANACFSQSSCEAPDWDADPFGGKGKPPQNPMSKAVKDCLKRKLMEKIGAKFNDCLSKKGIKNVNFTALADAAGPGSEFDFEGQGGSDEKDGLHGMMKAKFNAVKALDKCAQKKGGTDSVKPIEVCLQSLKKEQKPKICSDFIKPCEAKVASADCKKRGEELHKAMCQCKKEKEAEISKKLSQLAQGQSKVGMRDVMKTVTDDQDMQDIAKQMDTCYKEAGEEEPPMIKLAMQMMAGGGGGPLQSVMNNAFSFNSSMVVIMSDMIALDSTDDTECQPCP